MNWAGARARDGPAYVKGGGAKVFDQVFLAKGVSEGLDFICRLGGYEEVVGGDAYGGEGLTSRVDVYGGIGVKGFVSVFGEVELEFL